MARCSPLVYERFSWMPRANVVRIFHMHHGLMSLTFPITMKLGRNLQPGDFSLRHILICKSSKEGLTSTCQGNFNYMDSCFGADWFVLVLGFYEPLAKDLWCTSSSPFSISILFCPLKGKRHRGKEEKREI